MKTKQILLLLFVLTSLYSYSQDTTNIPDANFENYLETHDASGNPVSVGDNTSMGNGIENDHLVFTNRISGVISLNVNNEGIADLIGIENFTTLVTLNCGLNNLTSLDISLNTSLTELICYGNRLTTLDVSQNTSLTTLGCSSNQLNTLDLTQNTSLTFLNCSRNQLTTLDVTQNTSLTTLGCSSNQLNTLDITQNTSLTSLDCSYNQLSTLDVSQHTSLTKLYCGYNQLNTLDVSQNTSLRRLYCSYDQLNTLDVSQNTSLTHLSCSINQLNTLDVSQNTSLTTLYCGNNLLSTLDVSQNASLTILYCDNNQLTSLNVKNGNNTSIYDADFYATNNPNLTCIEVDDVNWSNSNWTSIDDTANFSENCFYPDSLFITTWKTETANETITIPTVSGLQYNFYVDWGDNSPIEHFEFNNSVTATSHTYNNAGTYTVSISGTFPRIHFNNQGDKDKILSVEQWGTIHWSSMASAFSGCSNLVVNSVYPDEPDLSDVTNMIRMFRGCTSLRGNTENHFNHWDVSHVENMNGLFAYCQNYNQPLNEWVTSNVTFTFDTTQERLEGMFEEATSFNQNLGAWNISSLENAYAMFNNSGMSVCNFDATLEGWSGQQSTPTGITLGAESIHYTNTEAYNALTTTNNWNIIGATPLFDETSNPFGPFLAGTNFTLPTLTGNDQGVWTPNIDNQETTTYTYALDTNDNNNNDNQCSIVKEVVIIDPQDSFITTWKTETANETIIIPLVSTETYDFYINWDTDNTSIYQHITSSSNLTHEYPTPGTYTVSISGTFPRIYFRYQGDKDKILSVEQWGTIQWSSMQGAFYRCSNLVVNSVYPDEPDLSSVTDMRFMFSGCTSLRGDSENHFNHWDVSHVENMSSLFAYCQNFDQPLNEWVTSSVMHMSDMFYSTAFNQPLNNWDVSNVIQMVEMFASSSFDQDIGTWNTESLVNMEMMFDSCEYFNQDIGAWNTANVTNMYETFAGTSLFNQDISNWNTANVIYMSGMFEDATSFNQNLGAWDISSLTSSLYYMFDNSGMSVCNFDATLEGWSGQLSTPTGITLGAGNIHYTTEAYNTLTSTNNWNITGAIHEELPNTPIIDTNNPITACTTDENLTLTAVVNQIDGTSIVWHNEDNEVIQDPTLTDFGTVTYYAKREKEIDANCTLVSADSTAVTLTINKKPTIQPVENIRSCENTVLTEIQFSADVTDSTFEWTATGDDIGLPETSGTGNIQAFTSTNAGTTQITVKAINNGNCESDEIVFNINVTPCNLGCVLITNPIDGATAVVGTSNISWQAVNGATNYYISIGTTPNGTEIEDNYDIGSTNNYIRQGNWEEGQTYYVTIVAVTLDANGEIIDYTEDNCQEFSFTVQSELFMPNAFTPNNDGINDTYIIKNIEYLYPKYMLYIYDRWGSLVYKGKNGWTGKSNNLRALGAEKVYKGAYYMIVDLGNGETLKQTIMINY